MHKKQVLLLSSVFIQQRKLRLGEVKCPRSQSWQVMEHRFKYMSFGLLVVFLLSCAIPALVAPNFYFNNQLSDSILVSQSFPVFRWNKLYYVFSRGRTVVLRKRSTSVFWETAQKFSRPCHGNSLTPDPRHLGEPGWSVLWEERVKQIFHLLDIVIVLYVSFGLREHRTIKSAKQMWGQSSPCASFLQTLLRTSKTALKFKRKSHKDSLRVCEPVKGTISLAGMLGFAGKNKEYKETSYWENWAS